MPETPLPYLVPGWRPIFEANDWRSFDAIWDDVGKWVETPNRRRGGWGAVARHELRAPDASRVSVYVKRHLNQQTRSLRRPWRGEPTLVREFRNTLRCSSLGIGCPLPIYCDVRREHGQTRALLISEELRDHSPLADWLAERRAGQLLDPRWQDATHAVARLLRQLHAAGYKVNSFTPNHIFLGDGEDEALRASLIDLERLKRARWSRRAQVHDLATLWRAMPRSDPADRVRFVDAYLEDADPARRHRLCRAIDARLRRRARRRQKSRAGPRGA